MLYLFLSFVPLLDLFLFYLLSFCSPVYLLPIYYYTYLFAFYYMFYYICVYFIMFLIAVSVLLVFSNGIIISLIKISASSFV